MIDRFSAFCSVHMHAIAQGTSPSIDMLVLHPFWSSTVLTAGPSGEKRRPGEESRRSQRQNMVSAFDHNQRPGHCSVLPLVSHPKPTL